MRRRGKSRFNFSMTSKDGFVTVADAEKEFVVRIILGAVAGEIFVSLGVQAANGLEIADGRSVIRRMGRFSSMTEKLPRAVKREEIIDKRNGGDAKKNVDEVTRPSFPPSRGKTESVLSDDAGATLWPVFAVSKGGL